MNLNASLENIKLSRPILQHGLLLILIAVCLTACSASSDGLLLPQKWTGKEAAPVNPISVIDPTPAANIPDLPPDIIKCVQRPLCTKGEKKTADQIVTDCAQSDEERRVCSRKLLAHYDKIQAANGVKKAAPAAKATAKQKPLKASELKKLEP